MSLGTDDQYLFAGTNGSNIWRRPLSQVVTDVNEELNIQPEQYSLEQNYPNPFNPTTSIRYQVSSIAQVTLKVYDILGNEVARLVNEDKPVGSYEVDFDASQLSSGIYLYKLTAGNFIETRKMILIK